jgi:hypothetical protein
MEGRERRGEEIMAGRRRERKEEKWDEGTEGKIRGTRLIGSTRGYIRQWGGMETRQEEGGGRKKGNRIWGSEMADGRWREHTGLKQSRDTEEEEEGKGDRQG